MHAYCLKCRIKRKMNWLRVRLPLVMVLILALVVFAVPAQATDMGEIHSAETKTGNISSKGQTDSFTFNGEAGQTVIIQMSQESGSLDPRILLYDPYGSEETSASGAATALISNYQLLQSGLYTIVAKDEFGSDTGEYSLSLTKIPSTLPPGIYNPFPLNKAIANLGQSFTWDAVEGATGYDLYFGENVTIPLEKIGENLPSPEMPFPEMVVDKVYYWHVEAYTPGGSIEGPYWWFQTSEAPPKGDFDGDNDVDFDDFVAFGDCYGSQSGDANYNAIGDFDDSGAIDFDDFVAFGDVYGT